MEKGSEGKMANLTKEFFRKINDALNTPKWTDKYLALSDLFRDPGTTPDERKYLRFLMNTTYGFDKSPLGKYDMFDSRKAQEITDAGRAIIENLSIMNAESLSDLYPHVVSTDLLSEGGVDQHVADDLAEDYMSNDAVYRYADELHGRTMDLLRDAQYEGLNTNDLKDRIKFCEAVMEMAHRLKELEK
uniref:Uncharacterized protein n=1 Tax=Ochrobactrum phage ORM_20 TaxID=2985243 RepID=A0A9N6WUY2_9VIRU|nr:hypothetical protein ORM20_00109 [Ochrobactrum phage ORM_20]